MKPTFLALSLLLIFSFIANIPLAFSQDAEQVKDTNGNPIILGGLYYILPATRGISGGGVSLDPNGSSTCPLTVLQNYSDAIDGVPVRFLVPGRSSTPGTISTGTPLDITFAITPVCEGSGSSKWTVVDDDGFPRTWVGIGGDGKGSFNIQQHDDGYNYKLVFCPTLTIPNGACFDIGRYNDKSNGRRLILADGDPYQVQFVYYGARAGSNGISSVV